MPKTQSVPASGPKLLTTALTAIASAVLSAALMYALMTRRQEPAPSTPLADRASVSANSANATSTAAGRAAAAAPEVRTLARRLERLEAAANATPAPRGQRSPSDPVEMVERMEAEAQRARAAHMKRFAEVERLFSTEAREAAWADGKEREIKQAFQDAKIHGSQVVGADCHATFCRVEVQNQTDDMSAFEGFWEHHPDSVYIQHLPAKGENPASSIVFVLRTGHEENHVLFQAMAAR
jgi:hypothetical protein